MTEHAFHGIHTSAEKRKCYPCVRNDMSLCLGPLSREQPRRLRSLWELTSGFRYLYSEDELHGWLGQVRALAEQAERCTC